MHIQPARLTPAYLSVLAALLFAMPGYALPDAEFFDPVPVFHHDFAANGFTDWSSSQIFAAAKSDHLEMIAGGADAKIYKSIVLPKGRYTLTAMTAGSIGIRISTHSESRSNENWSGKYLDSSRDGREFERYTIDFEADGKTDNGNVRLIVQIQGEANEVVKIKHLSITPSASFTFVDENRNYEEYNWNIIGDASLDADYAFLKISGATGDGISRDDVRLPAQTYLLTATGRNVTVEMAGESLNLDGAGLYKVINVSQPVNSLKITTNGGDGYIKGVSLKPVLDIAGSSVANIVLPPEEYVISVSASSGAANLKLTRGTDVLLNKVIAAHDGAVTRHYYYKSDSASPLQLALNGNISVDKVRIERGPLHYYQSPENLRGWTYFAKDSERTRNEDLDTLKATGANFVRLAAMAGGWESDSADMKKNIYHLVLAVEAACARELRVVVLLKNLPLPYEGDSAPANDAIFWNDPDLADNFIEYWTAVATELKKRNLLRSDCVVGYDLVNEPDFIVNQPLARISERVPPVWRSMAQTIVNAIREVDDQSWIIYEPGAAGLGNGFDYLKPLADHKVIYSQHFYATVYYTLQNQLNSKLGADECDTALVCQEEKVSYPYWWGDPDPNDPFQLNRDSLENHLNHMDLFEAKYQVPVYIGEFNTVKWADDADVWLRDVIHLLEKRNWIWTVHGWREWEGWDTELNDAYFKAPYDPETHQLASGTISSRLCVIAAGLNNGHDPAWPYKWRNDCDQDGMADVEDNCPLIPNGDQRDTDKDGKGNICESDNDNDGLLDAEEISLGSNPLRHLDPPRVSMGASWLIGFDDADRMDATEARFSIWHLVNGFHHSGVVNEKIDGAMFPGFTYGCSLVQDRIDCGNGILGAVVKAESAGDYSCALLANGKLKCWFAADTTDARHPALVGLASGVMDFSLFGGTADAVGCAVSGTTNIACWNNNGKYQPANPFTVTSGSPLRAEWSAVAVGMNHVCFIDAGDVHCRRSANGSDTELGDSDSDGYVDIDGAPITNARKIVAGDNFTCVLRGAYQRGNGEVSCWGSGAPLVAGLSKPVSITALADTLCVIDAGVTNREEISHALKCFGGRHAGPVEYGTMPAL